MDSTHAPLSTGEVVCWHCAEQAGEFEVPREMEWRVGTAVLSHDDSGRQEVAALPPGSSPAT